MYATFLTHLRGTWTQAWGHRALRALLHVVGPALLSGLCFYYLLPCPIGNEATGGLEAAIRQAHAQPVTTVVVWFIVFALVARYWSTFLPNPRPLAPAVSEHEPGEDGETVPVARRDPRWQLSRPLLSWAAVIVGALLVAFGLRAVVSVPRDVLSGSMLPTLLPGDRVVSDRLAVGGRRPPRRGDVIVFSSAGLPVGENAPEMLTKRIIGLPGDRITVRNGHPIINGWRVPSCKVGPYAYVTVEKMLYGTLSVEWLDERPHLILYSPQRWQIRKEYEVQPGEVFVLGDNRSSSSDSRDWQVGVRWDSVEGRVDRVAFGLQRNGKPSFSRLLTPLDLTAVLPGVDTTELRQGIERCLKNPPEETHVPPPR